MFDILGHPRAGHSGWIDQRLAIKNLIDVRLDGLDRLDGTLDGT